MSEYVLTPAAMGDLDEIVDYVARYDSVNAALRVERDLMAGAQRIGEFPHIGHARPDLTDRSARVWHVHRWLIIYRPETKPGQIIRIMRGERDIGAMLD